MCIIIHDYGQLTQHNLLKKLYLLEKMFMEENRTHEGRKVGRQCEERIRDHKQWIVSPTDIMKACRS